MALRKNTPRRSPMITSVPLTRFLRMPQQKRHTRQMWYDPPKADKVNNQTALGGFFYGQTVWFSVFVFPNLLAANSISCCSPPASPQGIDAQASQGGCSHLDGTKWRNMLGRAVFFCWPGMKLRRTHYSRQRVVRPLVPKGILSVRQTWIFKLVFANNLWTFTINYNSLTVVNWA